MNEKIMQPNPQNEQEEKLDSLFSLTVSEVLKTKSTLYDLRLRLV